MSVDHFEHLSYPSWVLRTAAVVLGVDPRLHFADFVSDEFDAIVEHLRVFLDEGGDFFVIFPRQCGVDRQGELSFDRL